MNYWEKRKKAFTYAGQGIRRFFKEEAHAQIHLIMAVLVLISGFIFKLNRLEWLIVLLCIGIVMMAEMINSAIENVVDLVSPEKKELAGKAKDLAAGAVLVASIIAACIGLILFVPKALLLISSIVN